MDSIKEVFEEMKNELFLLQADISSIKSNQDINNQQIKEITNILADLYDKYDKVRQTNKQTLRHINSTGATDTSTHDLPLEGLKPINLPVSNGNEGVSTDRQTDTQTNRQTQNMLENSSNSIENAVEILNSLDEIKKEIRLKFKRLTDQEVLVFSTIYQLDEEVGYSNYKSISERLNLTESSIRDYVGRLIKKGIPVEKNKINNKNIQLSLSNNLKKIASLNTILQLRDI
jgi:DNA-binding MarR family transcriptional regulator